MPNNARNLKRSMGWHNLHLRWMIDLDAAMLYTEGHEPNLIRSDDLRHLRDLISEREVMNRISGIAQAPMLGLAPDTHLEVIDLISPDNLLEDYGIKQHPRPDDGLELEILLLTKTFQDYSYSVNVKTRKQEVEVTSNYHHFIVRLPIFVQYTRVMTHAIPLKRKFVVKLKLSPHGTR